MCVGRLRVASSISGGFDRRRPVAGVGHAIKTTMVAHNASVMHLAEAIETRAACAAHRELAH